MQKEGLRALFFVRGEAHRGQTIGAGREAVRSDRRSCLPFVRYLFVICSFYPPPPPLPRVFLGEVVLNHEVAG